MNDSGRIARNGGDDSDWSRSFLTHPLVVGVVAAVVSALIPIIFTSLTWSLPAVSAVGVAILLLGLGLLIWGRRYPMKAWLFVVAMTLVTVGGFTSGSATQTWAWTPPPVNQRPSPTSSSAPAAPTSRVGLPIQRISAQPRDCFNVANDKDSLPGVIVTVSCDDPHNREVFFAGDSWDHSQPYPGEEQSLEQAHELCAKEFLKYVGISKHYSVLRQWVWVPGAKNWETGDRRMVCLAYHPGKSLRYSVEGLAG